MIAAAGLGVRLRPLTALCPKPALPVRGIPLIAYALEWLRHAGVTETIINLHHLPDALRAVALRFAPAGMALHFSHEAELLHTGGAIMRCAEFLRESDPCIIIGGDMLVDLDLPALVNAHLNSGPLVTMALVQPPRAAADYGTIALDARGRLRRVAGRFTNANAGAETQSGIYTWVNVVSAAAFESAPALERFNHLDDWWLPLSAAQPDAIGGVHYGAADCRWIPVGTPAEYLAANFDARPLSYFNAAHAAEKLGAQLLPNAIIGAGANVDSGARLEKVVVWEGEQVPANANFRRGVFAAGRFHPLGNGNGNNHFHTNGNADLP